MFAQIIDDTSGKTLVSLHSKKIVNSGDVGERTGRVATSFLLGKQLAAMAIEHKITTVVFDRAGYRYHGRVKAVADGAREGGLVF
jgi:large subunit ribosomal protein L18